MSISKNLQEFAERRKKCFAQLGANSLAILFNGSPALRNGDIEYPFRPSSDFYYLTGLEEPDAIAVFAPDRPEGEYILFNLPANPEQERWTGKRLGQERACTVYGANQAFSLDAFENEITKLFSDKKTIFYAFDDPLAETKIHALVKNLPKHTRFSSSIPRRFENISPILHELRLFKSEQEIHWMREAAQISVKAHQQTIKICRPGLFEYQLEAELKYVFTQNGAKFEAYPSIVANGNNACTLHYNDNSGKLKDGDLVLVDAGCEYQYYASDITRTFPVNGKFTDAQRKIYQVVLDAQLAGIAEAKPGNPWNHIHTTTTRVVTEGLVKLGILQGSIETLLEQKAYQRFYLHHFGHWIGLDTHDPSNYQIDGNPRLLESGMVLTVEPGIYIPHEYEDVDPKWRGIGIRIEDDVLVTDHGPDVLSKGLAKSIEEIEALMKG